MPNNARIQQFGNGLQQFVDRRNGRVYQRANQFHDFIEVPRADQMFEDEVVNNHNNVIGNGGIEDFAPPRNKFELRVDEFGEIVDVGKKPEANKKEKKKQNHRDQQASADRYIRGYAPEDGGMTEKEAVPYFTAQKKRRHLIKRERERLHKIKKDGKLKTVNLDVSDLVPA